MSVDCGLCYGYGDGMTDMSGSLVVWVLTYGLVGVYGLVYGVGCKSSS